MKTEEEARKCWCPHARVSSSDGEPSSNRQWYRTESGVYEVALEKCIASECMMWRWGPHSLGRARTGEALVGGYCGLADVPTVIDMKPTRLTKTEVEQAVSDSYEPVRTEAAVAILSELGFIVEDK